jgi:hypothetical protein
VASTAITGWPTGAVISSTLGSRHDPARDLPPRERAGPVKVESNSFQPAIEVASIKVQSAARVEEGKLPLLDRRDDHLWSDLEILMCFVEIEEERSVKDN